MTENFIVENPSLWSPETPFLYEARTVIYAEGKPVDSYNTAFGIRSIEFVPYKGFFLNGQRRKFQGVCNHHDLGPLGAAVNVSALRHQLMLLKDMGCDAVRTSHNMPAPELVRLCDEMGFMMMIEPFDEWDVAKCTNGYHRFFDEWAERDMVNMLHCWRNNPCVVMWSIGNEVPTQCSPDGYKVAEFLQDICHREDPTRPVTCGMDQVSCVLDNGFAALVDIPGLNYRTFRYKEAYVNAKERDIVIVKSPVGMPGRAIRNAFIRRVEAGEQIPHSPCHGCLHKCDPSAIPYCITDALIHAAKGEIDEALLFCGADAWKADRIETVKEVIDSLL